MLRSRLLAGAASLLTVLVLLAVGIAVWPPEVALGLPPSSTIYLPLIQNCPSTPTLSQPANGATLTTLTPLFVWAAPAIGGQSTFYVDITTDPSFSSYDYLFVDSSASSPCAGQLRYPGNLNTSGNPPVTYYWRVSVETNGNIGPYSAISSFTVPTESSGTLLPAPMITAPLNNAANVLPSALFKWQAVPGASDYLVVWEPSDASSYSFEYTTGTQLTPAAPLTLGTAYDVFVAARNDFGTSDPQARAHFTTSGTAPASVLSRRLVPSVAHGARSVRHP